MIKRRKFLKISALGAGTIAAASNLVLGETKPIIQRKPNIPFVPYFEGISPEELKSKNDFLAKYIQNMEEIPFSFKYGGKESVSFLKTWTFKKEEKKIDESRNQFTLTWTDSTTNLEVKSVAVDYLKYPCLEWTIYFTNKGKTDSWTLEDIKGIDIQITRPEEEAVDLRSEKKEEREFILNSNTGDIFREDSFMPHRTRLEFDSSHHFAPIDGRSSNGTLPYFNLQWGGKDGLAMAIGWPGQWSADFKRDENLKCRITAGQEMTHFNLYPGESARTPLIALLFYKGDKAHGQNIWRRWMNDHNLFKRNGKPLEPFAATCMGFEGGEASENKHIDDFVKENSGVEYWWMDAGWYTWDKDESWGVLSTGSWTPDPKRYPKGVRAVSDHAHAKGLKFILWFEPERVSPGRPLAEKKDWLLKVSDKKKVRRYEQNTREQRFIDHEAKRNQIKEDDMLYNLGNDEARIYLTNLISKSIKDNNLDVYRHDFNISPLEFWKNADEPSRIGMTENKYVTGFLQFWDDLLKRHPNIYIDTCASGGRRIDLETLRRSYPLLISDFQGQAQANQNHSYGLASWVPYFGTGNGMKDKYTARTGMYPYFGVGLSDPGMGFFREMIGEWKQIRQYFSGDYYPLTSYSLGNDVWMAWQYYRPDLNEGFVQVFRRENSPFTNAKLKLNGLMKNETYSIINFDQKEKTIKMKGLDLMSKGLEVEISDTPGSAIFLVKKV